MKGRMFDLWCVRLAVLLSVLVAPALALAQSAAIVGTDYESNAVDMSNSTTRQAEKETINDMIDFVNKWSDRINAAMDTVNNVMNTAGEYVATAREVEQAEKDVESVISLYRTFVSDISSQQWLTPSRRLYYINQIIGEVEAMQSNFSKILSVSGKKGKDAGVSGRMNDGQRLKLIRGYAAYISETCQNIRNIYSYATTHAASVKCMTDSYVSAFSSLAGF